MNNDENQCNISEIPKLLQLEHLPKLKNNIADNISLNVLQWKKNRNNTRKTHPTALEVISRPIYTEQNEILS